MIRPRDREAARRLEADLTSFSRNVIHLPGIDGLSRRQTFIAQLLESMRRIELIDRLKMKPISIVCTDPHHNAFNPIKAAIYHTQNGDRDEAFWLVFLLTHFSKHHRQGWSLTRAVYGKLGVRPFWSWHEISSDPAAFRSWLRLNQPGLSGMSFGNHRKYESIREDSERGLARVVESYIDWIKPPRTHDQKIQSIVRGINDPSMAFDALYAEASSLYRWGRLAKFDHLTMLNKVGLLEIVPGRTYLANATGPRKGAALLLHGNPSHPLDILAAEAALGKLGHHLNVGQQEMEDSLCNWQKSPDLFVAFR